MVDGGPGGMTIDQRIAQLEQQIAAATDPEQKRRLAETLRLERESIAPQDPDAGVAAPPVTPQAQAGLGPSDAGTVQQPAAGMPRGPAPEPEPEIPPQPIEPVRKTGMRPVQRAATAAPTGGKITLGSGSTTRTVTEGVPYPEEQLERTRAAGETRISEMEDIAAARRGVLGERTAEQARVDQQVANVYDNLIASERREYQRLAGETIEGKPVSMGLLEEISATDEPGMDLGADEPGMGRPPKGPPKVIGRKRLPGLVERYAGKLDEAEKELTSLREDIAKFELDPRESVEGWRIALGAIADAARTLGSSIASGGRNLGGGAGASFVSKIIDAQLSLQEKRLNKMMKVYGLTSKQRDFLSTAWKDLRKQKELKKTRLAELQVMRIGAMSKSKEMKAAAIDTALEMRDKVSKLKSELGIGQAEREIEAKEKAAPKITKQKTSAWRQQYIKPSAPATGEFPPKEIQERLSVAASLTEEFDKFWQLYQKEGGFGKAQWLRKMFPGGSAMDVQNWAKGLGVQQAVAVQGSRPAKEEQEIYAGWFPQSSDLAPVAKAKMQRQMRRLAVGMAQLVRQYEPQGYDMTYARDILSRVMQNPLMRQ